MGISIAHPYLLFPIKNGAEITRISLMHQQTVVRYLDIELDRTGKPDWIAAYPVSALMGGDYELIVDGQPAGADTETLVRQGNEIWQPDDLYREERRPGFHFSPRTGWQNDPNGLVLIGDVWHLFYQHNPVGIQWGNMHWGHAVSADLVHWDELDDELFPDSLGTMFSGCGIIDENNATGLATGSEPPVLLYYTAAGQHAPSPIPFTQCLAISTDAGNTFRKYEGNPIIPTFTPSNRDPKVIQVAGAWIMALYLEKQNDRQVFTLLRSEDLLTWDRFQDIELPGTGECPDFFPLAVDGDVNNQEWVFMAADGVYVIGEFDGMRFAFKEGPFEGIVGGSTDRNAAYASQTFAAVPNGRVIQVSWIRGDVEESHFNMSMSIPMDLHLRTFADGVRLCAEPIPELVHCHQSSHTYNDIDARGSWAMPDVTGNLVDITIMIDDSAEGKLIAQIYGLSVELDASSRTISYGDHCVPILSRRPIEMRVLIDRCSLELFSDQGRCRMAYRAFPDYSAPAVNLTGEARVRKIIINEVE